MKREIKHVRFVVIAILLFCDAGLMSSGTLLALSQHEVPGRAQGTLTLQERVSYQRAIEEVYWRHRIWPKERPDPKPSLDAVISQAQLEKKVESYLRNSQALEDYWQRPITAEQLQAEMDRMAQNTKQPEVLQELFEALGNDPFVIAECLARPILAERLLADPEFERVKQQSRTFDQTVAAGANYILPGISDPSGGCIGNTWTPTNLTGATDARISHTAVWTGSEMIVWGGYGCDQNCVLNTGGKYNPSTDSWTATSTTNAPEGRVYHTAVWTGSEMIVWGGIDESGAYSNSGGRYNPTADSWTPTSTTNVPGARFSHTAVWTGSEMIVWGGSGDTINFFFNTGGRYNPSTNSWTATSTANAPAPRNVHTAVWTGTQMIVWGGQDPNGPSNTGGRYNPSTNSWTATSTANAPERRDFQTAAWTGSNMIVWGGSDLNGEPLNTGGRYNPSTNAWTATNTANAPDARDGHTAVWTGSNMIVWGGFDNHNFLNSGGRYYPDVNGWVATDTTDAPSSRSSHTAVWTGSEMVVWGGNSGNGGGELNTGGRYCVPSGPPPTPTPSPTPAPTPCTGGCTVTNTNDSGPGSLRQALAVAHNGDRITFAVSGAITLTSGGLPIVKNVTISGPGANQLAVNGNQALFVFGVFPQRTVSISGLGIRNAQVGVYNNQGTVSVSNCVLSGNSSAGLYNDASQGSIGASMTVANSNISNNSGTGAFNNQGTLAVSSCVLSGNSTGVYNNAGQDGASMTVTNSNISNNSFFGALNFLPLPDGSGCACMTISGSTVSNNAPGGIRNSGNNFGNGTASLTVVNSNVSDNDGIGIGNNGCDGSASATILSTAVSGNSAGGVDSLGLCGLFDIGSAQITITDCTISGNSANSGIRSATSALTVANSTISDNSSGDTGGGIFASSVIIGGPHVSIVNSTISGNSAGTSGGGIYYSGSQDASIVNSTVSGNSAGTSGGGISNVGSSFHVENSTITGNSAGSGGGIYNDGGQSEISNTILNAGASGENIVNSGGTVTSHGYNLSSDDGGGYLNGPGDQINTDPMLGPLQNHGGPTFIHALSLHSPAINAGDPSFAPPPSYDQRGSPFVRVFNGRLDIGSFEAQPGYRHPTPHPRPTPP